MVLLLCPSSVRTAIHLSQQEGCISDPPKEANAATAYSFQAEFRIIEQKFIRLKLGLCNTSTSSLTVPNVVSGLCLKPSLKALIISSLKWFPRGVCGHDRRALRIRKSIIVDTEDIHFHPCCYQSDFWLFMFRDARRCMQGDGIPYNINRCLRNAMLF